MPTLDVPAALPYPRASDITASERRLLSAAPARQARTIQRDRHYFQNLEWLFTLEQSSVFSAWLTDELVAGGAWFAADWPHPLGGVAVRKFIGAPSWTYVPGGFWRVSALCEVLGRAELPITGDTGCVPTQLFLDTFSGPGQYLVSHTPDTAPAGFSYAPWGFGGEQYGAGLYAADGYAEVSAGDYPNETWLYAISSGPGWSISTGGNFDVVIVGRYEDFTSRRLVLWREDDSYIEIYLRRFGDGYFVDVYLFRFIDEEEGHELAYERSVEIPVAGDDAPELNLRVRLYTGAFSSFDVTTNGDTTPPVAFIDYDLTPAINRLEMIYDLPDTLQSEGRNHGFSLVSLTTHCQAVANPLNLNSRTYEALGDPSQNSEITYAFNTAGEIQLIWLGGSGVGDEIIDFANEWHRATLGPGEASAYEIMFHVVTGTPGQYEASIPFDEWVAFDAESISFKLLGFGSLGVRTLSVQATVRQITAHPISATALITLVLTPTGGG